MREPGGASTRDLRPCDGTVAAEQLRDEPKNREEPRGDFHRGDEDDHDHQGVNPGAWEAQQISPHDPGDRPARAYRGNARIGGEEYLYDTGDHAAQKIETEKFSVAHGVLQAASKRPEEQHVADDVGPAAMQEERRQQRKRD